MRRWLAVTLLALCAGPSLSRDGGHGTQTSPTGQRWDFTLPALDGSHFVQAAALRGPVLVNFWGRDCGPCITELPRLEAFAHANPTWTVLLVSTDPPNVATEFVRRIGLKGIVLRSGANVAGLMRSAGNRQGALPFSVGLHEGKICRTLLGELHEADLARWSAACATP
jgi:thiol-disulfide isomerase/thioredoxin